MANDLSDEARKRFRERALRLCVWLAVGGLFTWAVVDYSLRKGRLVVPPTYDDVGYMTDGLRRLQIFKKEGLLALIRDCIGTETHSPLASAIPFAGYALFGEVDWAPYVVNGIQVLGLLIGIDALCHGRPFWEKAGLALFALSVRLVAYSVHEIKPDAPAAFLGAATAAVIFHGPWIGSTRKRQAAAGILAGLSLIAKPTIVPLMLALFGFEMLLAAARDRFDAPAEWTLAKALRPCLIASGVALAVALPYYAVNAGHVYTYFTEVYRAYLPLRKEPPMRFFEAATYYLFGFGGKEMLAKHVFLWLALFAAAGCYALRIRDRVPWRHVAIWALVIGAAYAVVTINQLRSHFLGLTFQVMAFAALLTVLAWFWRELEARGVKQAVRVAAMLALVAAGWLCSKKPPVWSKPHQERAVAWNAASANLHRLLHSEDGAGRSRVFFAAIGDINDDLMRYLDYQKGKPVLQYHTISLSENLPDYEKAVAKADWVVANEAGDTSLAWEMPSTRFAGQSLKMMEAHPDFERVARIPMYAGKIISVFRRKSETTGAAVR